MRKQSSGIKDEVETWLTLDALRISRNVE